MKTLHVNPKKAILTYHVNFLYTQTFEGPRCDLHKNIIAQGCKAEAIIKYEGDMKIEQVSLHHSHFSFSQTTILQS